MLKLVYCLRRKPEMSVEDLISTFDRNTCQEVLKGYRAWHRRMPANCTSTLRLVTGRPCSSSGTHYLREL